MLIYINCIGVGIYTVSYQYLYAIGIYGIGIYKEPAKCTRSFFVPFYY
jgi:hypothetical protein